MIVVKLELWPLGSEEHMVPLGAMAIVNDGTGSERRGNYDIGIVGKTPIYKREARVEDYPRKAYHAWELVRRALNSVEQGL